MVLKVDSLALQERLGAKARSPRWALAYKFAATQETTRVLGHRGQRRAAPARSPPWR